MWLGPPYIKRKITLLARGGKMRRPGRQRIFPFPCSRAVGRHGLLVQKAVVAQHAGQCHSGEPATRLPEEFTSSAAAELTFSGRFAGSVHGGFLLPMRVIAAGVLIQINELVQIQYHQTVVVECLFRIQLVLVPQRFE